MQKKSDKRILVVEDEAHIAQGLKLNLSLKGYDVCIAKTGVEALQQWKDWQPDLIVLDIMLPGIDGFSVLQNIRLEDDRVPILILSAKSDSSDKVKGFTFGVDDYLAKPFDLEEFLLRVERLLARASQTPRDTEGRNGEGFQVPRVYIFGTNRIDFETATAQCKAGKINLTEQEINLLKLFITNKGKPLSRRRILEIGWGYAGATSTRTVDNFIVRFRKYFEEKPKKPLYFKSVRSIGYLFDHE
jgi:DNA-binding response OmpR family regulator